ncbi:unnamed protein product [Cuscuta europaea]|uniref:Uncharacterized protein n=1 Tax=Cuscuta europaea TaxID=41803 RepID=A0A9P1DZY7_CUSEU|nr:unnamed protein product [Cuscuta europaea]
MVPQPRATPSSVRADASKGKQIVGEDHGQKRPKAEPAGDERPPKKSRHGEGSSKAVVVLDGSDNEAASPPKPPPNPCRARARAILLRPVLRIRFLISLSSPCWAPVRSQRGCSGRRPLRFGVPWG